MSVKSNAEWTLYCIEELANGSSSALLFCQRFELYVLVSLYRALQSIICSKDGNDFPLFIGFNLNYLLAIFIYYFNIHVYGHSTPKFKSSCSG